MEQKFTGNKANFTRNDFWNQRYAGEDFVYGKRPNAWFKQNIDGLKPGRLLLPAEGEGRNAVYAASLGWTVDAFDFSPEARGKAERLMGDRSEAIRANIDYQLGDFLTYSTDRRYDLIGLIFTHFGPEVRQAAFRRYSDFLKPGGYLVAEFFSPDQLGRTSGGPKHPDWLITTDELTETFQGLKIEYLKTLETELNEGDYHSGSASVTRFLGKL